MNKKICMLMMILAGISTYGKESKVYSEPNYRVLSEEETVEPIERGAYDNLLRVVDEINRKKGTPSGYLKKAYKVDARDEDKISIIPVAQTGEGTEEGNYYRFYLGNGNKAQNVEIVSKKDFDSKVKNSKDDTEYLIEGVYKNKSPWLGWKNENGLGITMDDYKNSIQGKSTNEVLNFLKNKLIEHNINTVIENEEIYSVDVKGEKWKILWNLEPVSAISYWPEGYQDGIFANFYIYDDKDFARELYSKKGDIYIENNKDSIIKDKHIEFRGKGIINGNVDFGKNSQITVTEQFTGKYGTNVVFGPYAKLKNVQTFLIGGMIGSLTDASLSGRTSVTMDLDTDKKDTHGNYYQHFLKDSDKDMIITSVDSILDRTSYSFGEESAEDKKRKELNRDNYSIEVMISKLNEDGKIDLGRKTSYVGPSFNLYKPQEKVEYHLKFVPDSIATQLDIEKGEGDKSDLLVVKIRKNIKGLSGKENAVYKSLKDSKQLSHVGPTLSNTNKRTVFSAKEDEIFNKKLHKLASDLRNSTPDEILETLDQFGYEGERREELKKEIEKIQNSPEIKKNILRHKEKDKYKEKVVFDYIKVFDQIDFKKLGEFDSTDEEADKTKNQIEKIYRENLKPLYEKLVALNVENNGDEYFNGLEIREGKDLASKLKLVEEGLENYGKSPWKTKSEFLKRELILYLKDAGSNLKRLCEIDADELDRRLTKELDGGFGSITAKYYKKLLGDLLYTQREEEALSEFKIIIDQLQKKNIYSRVNKISKNEMDTYVNMPFNISHDFKKGRYIGGGAITNRNSMDDFKGNIYTGYGIYEVPLNEKTNVGMVAGGGATSHNEIKDDTLKSVTTSSKIKGYSGYISGYTRYQMTPSLKFLGGIGAQYGDYNVDRDMKNNYQNDIFKGKVKTVAFNGYTGVIHNYKITEGLSLETQGILSYTLVNQGKIKEKEKPLSLDIDSNSYNYLDGQLGVNLRKTVVGENLDSSISGGVYFVHGFAGYDNKDLKGRFKNSTSDFQIQGMKYKKDAVKVLLDYNVDIHNGFTYGLEGSYITNSEKDGISIGVKAGYRF